MSNDLVGYSRAGDVFHYRWAAKRCLRMIYPNTTLTSVVIEGSNERKKAGEYVIDVAEYHETSNCEKRIYYYQLKHTTVQKDLPFTLSNFKTTFKGFADRFKQHHTGSGRFGDISQIQFIIVTNRKISDSLKSNITALSRKETVESKFFTTISNFTKLTQDELQIFASLLKFEDQEGDYIVQKNELRVEIAQLVPGKVDNTQIDTLEALVKDKVLPDSATNRQITKEEVLQRFKGITSIDDLYPAPAKLDENAKIIDREIYSTIKDRIINSSEPVIVHASGGVGKSVFCKKITSQLPADSFGIVFDCFGGGNYRKKSESRHLHRRALVQIVNELAVRGLCDPLLPIDGSTEENLMSFFLRRIESSLVSLKRVNKTAQLFILIDAADNAEMAAEENRDSSFAKDLLLETMPEDCKLVMLCRSERIKLLKPEDHILQIELEPFSEDESKNNLLIHFPDATLEEVKEFHRLTSGNPRVQANSLELKADSVSELLSRFGPYGITVEDQINLQLSSAIGKIRSHLTPQFQVQINSICTGLATLPPNIPLEILSKTSKVSIADIKSFISEIGRPLWLTDSSVQFRDEPTETWFRETFRGSDTDIQNYLISLEPISTESVYVAQVLPQLYLLAKQYQRLIDITLSDAYLPSNPVDARNVRVYRLQFAFKAAIKSCNYQHSLKLAMRAGEEVAGDSRQIYLFQKNIDLLIKLQDPIKIQELAFKRIISNSWPGSENVYSASLLSGINEYKGEASSFLRSSENWMRLFFEERDKTEESRDNYSHNGIQVETDDVLEMAYAHLNIYGVKKCVEFLMSFSPKSWVFNSVKDLARRLIDFGEYNTLNEILTHSNKDVHFVVAITSEFMDIGIIPEANAISKCLDLLCIDKHRIEKPSEFYYDGMISSIISFLEACLHRKLSSQKIQSILNYYVSEIASRSVYDTYTSRDQTSFLRSLAIRNYLNGSIDIKQLMPKHLLVEKKGHDLDQESRNFITVINGLLPWFNVRLNSVIGESNIIEQITVADTNSRNARQSRYLRHDTLPRTIIGVLVSILKYNTVFSPVELSEYYKKYLLQNNSFHLSERLDLLRSAFRMQHLHSLRNELEKSTREIIDTMQFDNGPEEVSAKYIEISRAVMFSDVADAKVYFEQAIVISSKFGQEINERWNAIVNQANHLTSRQSDQLAYRFIKCAEVVGDTVDREKYWDRGKAMMVCTKMSPGIGLSTLSRWRDRDIGNFEWLLYAILRELIENKEISTTVAWALTSFHSFEQRLDDDYLEFFLRNTTIDYEKQFIIDDFIHFLSINGVGAGMWARVSNILKSHNLNNTFIEKVEDSLGPWYLETPKPISKSGLLKNETDDSDKTNFIFESVDLKTLEGLEKALQNFETLSKEKDFYREKTWFWTKCFQIIESQTLLHFIELVLLSDDVDHYDIRALITSIPIEWSDKMSFKTKWPSIIESIGKRYAYNFIIPDSFSFFVKGIALADDMANHLKIGIFKGISDSVYFADSSQFFGFVNLASSLITQAELKDLLDYSLTRFEIHVDRDFGDGSWTEQLKPRKSINDNISGLIWSALGSPKSRIRWNALHAVDKLASLNCNDIIDSLIKWLESNNVESFGCLKYPFYNLHARQYLLIACARISKVSPGMLKAHSDTFLKYAISEPHLLIQKYAADWK